MGGAAAVFLMGQQGGATIGVAWKFLDAQQKGGTFETFNLWLRRKLKVDGNPPPPPVK